MQDTGPSGNLVPGGGRDLAALKEEVQRRTDRNMPPLTGIGSDDAKDALAQIGSLDREAWATAWCAVGDRRWERARSLDARSLAEVRDEYWRAWRLFHFARWPTENSPTRQRARHRALQAFQAYARLLDPPMETVRIPFEGKQIVGYLRLPLKPRPAPLVFGIAGLDSRKEDIAAHSDDYLERGKLPVRTFTGPKGTMLFCNTAGFHRGGFATGKARVLATFTYDSAAALKSLTVRNFRFERNGSPVDDVVRYALT